MLKFENVSFWYSSKKVIDSVTFEVKKGDFFVVVGPNGAGKSTIVKLIGRVIKPSSGRLYIDGLEFGLFDRKDFARKVAVVGQNPSYGFTKVADFVLLGRIPYFSSFQLFERVEDRKAVKEALKMCGIEALENRYMIELSGGERQLVFLAKAIATQSKVLVLDEPLTGLDVNNQETILFLLERLRKEMGLTIVAVLHDLNVASEFANRVMLLKNGKIYKLGEPSKILDDFAIKELYGTSEAVKTFRNPFSNKPVICITKPTGV